MDLTRLTADESGRNARPANAGDRPSPDRIDDDLHPAPGGVLAQSGRTGSERQRPELTARSGHPVEDQIAECEPLRAEQFGRHDRSDDAGRIGGRRECDSGRGAAMQFVGFEEAESKRVHAGYMHQRVPPFIFISPHACRNKITTYDAVSFMCLCPNILDLDLRDNPVAALDEYRDYMSDIMPTLKLLDAQAFYDVNGAGADESLSSSEYSSSTSEQRSASRGMWIRVLPSWCPTCDRIQSPTGSSVVSFVDLAHDTAPLSGSIVSAVRRRKTAWTSRSHSASSLSSRSSSSLSGGPPASSDPPPPPATTALASVSHNH